MNSENGSTDREESGTATRTVTMAKKPAAPVKKKPAAKKPIAKKPAARKPAAKKPAAKKPAAKKPAKKPAAKKKPAARKKSGLMGQLVQLLVKKTGLSEDVANQAAETMVDFLKDKLPQPLGSLLVEVLNSNILGEAREILGGR